MLFCIIRSTAQTPARSLVLGSGKESNPGQIRQDPVCTIILHLVENGFSVHLDQFPYEPDDLKVFKPLL